MLEHEKTFHSRSGRDHGLTSAVIERSHARYRHESGTVSILLDAENGTTAIAVDKPVEGRDVGTRQLGFVGCGLAG